MGEGGTLTLSTGLEDDAVRLTVADTGPGIPEDSLPRLFQSFYTTKAGGMGMGLPICRSILESCGGTIAAANGEAGAVFTVTLPAAG